METFIVRKSGVRSIVAIFMRPKGA
jgi:hypothetical protein